MLDSFWSAAVQFAKYVEQAKTQWTSTASSLGPLVEPCLWSSEGLTFARSVRTSLLRTRLK